MANNDWMLMISSDDIAYKNAFEVYNKIINNDRYIKLTNPFSNFWR